MERKEGDLVVSFGFTDGEGIDVLMVGRKEDNTLRIVNVLFDDAARDIYETLVGEKGE